jgi:hypothetical protein
MVTRAAGRQVMEPGDPHLLHRVRAVPDTHPCLSQRGQNAQR